MIFPCLDQSKLLHLFQMFDSKDCFIVGVNFRYCKRRKKERAMNSTLSLSPSLSPSLSLSFSLSSFLFAFWKENCTFLSPSFFLSYWVERLRERERKNMKSLKGFPSLSLSLSLSLVNWLYWGKRGFFFSKKESLVSCSFFFF